MLAKDVMTSAVVSVSPDTGVRDIARCLIERMISGVPVIDENGRPLGMVSEGDLIRRPESETEDRGSWWLRLLASHEEQAHRFVKSHGLKARDVMTRDLITASENSSLEEIATLLERHRIKRVPIMRDGKIVGIVSRADLLHGLVARSAAPASTVSDREIKEAFEKALAKSGVSTVFLSGVVSGGVLHLWGSVDSDDEKRAVQIVAEQTPGVTRVEDNVAVFPAAGRAAYWSV